MKKTPEEVKMQLSWELHVAQRHREVMGKAGPEGAMPGQWWAGRVKALEDVLELLDRTEEFSSVRLVVR